MPLTEERLPLPGNVLIAAEYLAPQSGNFIASMLDLASAVKEAGAQAAFLFPIGAETRSWVRWIRSEGFEVYFIDESAPAETRLQALRQIVAQNEIKLVHIHFGCMENFFLQNRSALGVCLVIHDHFDFVTNRSWLRQRLSSQKKALQYRRAGACCVSVMEKKDRWYWLMGKRRHSFIINGLSLRRGERDTLSREARRAEIGLREGERLVLFLGWDMYRKGLDIAIQAVELYRKRDPQLKIGVIGVGAEGKPTPQTEAFLRERGVDPHSEAIVYMHSYEDIFALNRAADCYISSSRAEAFSYGILEAISQNLPVVVSDIAGTSWSWDYSKCFRYPVNDPAACAEAIGKALPLRDAPSNHADLLRRYGNDLWSQRILAVYRQALSAQRP